MWDLLGLFGHWERKWGVSKGAVGKGMEPRRTGEGEDTAEKSQQNKTKAGFSMQAYSVPGRWI
jgi:hypothetical protein